jgi:hypothetical protein
MVHVVSHLAECASYTDMGSQPEFLLAWNCHNVLILICNVLVWFCDLFCWSMLILQLMLGPPGVITPSHFHVPF